MRKISRGIYEDTKGFVRFTEMLIEIAILTMVYYFVWRNSYPKGLFPEYYFKGKYVLMGVYALLLMVMFRNFDCTMFGHLRKVELIIGQIMAIFFVNVITYFQLSLIANQMISPIPTLLLLAVEIIISFVLVWFYTEIYYKLYAPHEMLLIYGSASAVELKLKMDVRQDKYIISKMISASAKLDELYEEILKHESVILNDIPVELRDNLLKFCYKNSVRTYVAPELTDIMLRGAKNNSLFDTPLLLVKGTGLSPMQRIVKRAMDVVLCLISLILVLPITLIVSLSIKIEDGGPVFYKQKRLTRNGVEFQLLKFRSMIVDAEKFSGAVLAEADDPRITKVGRILRATRLDELPQVFNILKGDMSIVGPRPERKILADKIEEQLPEFAYRLKVRGGLTGYAQIYGKYNTNSQDKLRLDMMYIQNYSLLLDIKLIILTLRIMLSKESTEGINIAEENRRRAEDLFQDLQK